MMLRTQVLHLDCSTQVSTLEAALKEQRFVVLVLEHVEGLEAIKELSFCVNAITTGRA